MVRVASFAISLDGYGAGPRQSLEHPLGVGGEGLHEWFYPTRTFQKQVLGRDGGATGIDEDFAARGFENIGAWILGRNMFGPAHDEEWKGWWGDNPPYHAPTFILTHYPRPSVEMLGGTTFHFVTDGIENALQRAREAAGAKDVKIGGGVATVRQYVQAGHVDEIHLAFAPVALGQGEPLFSGMDLRALGYRTVEHAPTNKATHIVLAK
jgi:dihydrofolate reductase